jgi:Putative zinc binding domain/C-methyltransferase C-terminal domain/Methyltransferase domain
MTELIEVPRCEVCDGGLMAPVINLGNLPLPDDLVPVGDPRVCKKYPTEVLWCDVCKTAQQRYVIPKKELFPPEYHYRGANTKDVLSGMEQLVESVEHQVGSFYGLRVLDVGCNDGSLLDAFRRRGAITTGMEPTDAAHEAAAKGHGIDHDYLDINSAYRYVKTYGVPDIITFVNVFAHIEDFPTLLSSLSILRGRETNPDLIPLRPARVVIENHYLGAVLEKNQFDTFYHEHIRTYSTTSFEHIARRLSMKLVKVEYPARYGGNIRVMLEQGTGDKYWSYETASYENDFGTRLKKLDRKVVAWRQRKQAQVFDGGPLAAAAMPGRATILFNLLGFNEKHITGVYEVPQSKKIGYYVPGTHIPILSDTDYPFETDGRVLNMAWHIPKEIEQRWRGLGFHGTMLQAVDSGDFNQT